MNELLTCSGRPQSLLTVVHTRCNKSSVNCRNYKSSEWSLIGHNDTVDNNLE